MNITYRTDITPATEDIIAVYNSSGITRPTTDVERITRMYKNSNLVVTAWQNDQLVGVARSVTDFCYSCYLSDLAVRQEFQHTGIGKFLVKLTKTTIGDECMLLLLSAATAMEYYPKIGMEVVNNGFIIRRVK
jgi:ribosomal protein S18 acetylase RimI-like enzyme